MSAESKVHSTCFYTFSLLLLLLLLLLLPAKIRERMRTRARMDIQARVTSSRIHVSVTYDSRSSFLPSFLPHRRSHFESIVARWIDIANPNWSTRDISSLNHSSPSIAPQCHARRVTRSSTLARTNTIMLINRMEWSDGEESSVLSRCVQLLSEKYKRILSRITSDVTRVSLKSRLDLRE